MFPWIICWKEQATLKQISKSKSAVLQICSFLNVGVGQEDGEVRIATGGTATLAMTEQVRWRGCHSEEA